MMPSVTIGVTEDVVKSDYISTASTSTAANGLEALSLSTIYYQAFVIAIAIVGTLANGSVCALLAQLELRKRGAINILILNQLSLDLFSCLWLLVTYSVQFETLYLTGTWGYLVCQFITSQLFIWIGLQGSVIGMVMITLERYAKLVHLASYKKYFRQWMIYAGVAISWVSGFLVYFPASWTTTNIVQGQCLSDYFWPSAAASQVYVTIYVLISFILPFCVFVYCYGHILVFIKRKAKVFGGNLAASDSLLASSLRIQMNIIRTMLIIVLFFALSWTPNQVFIILFNFGLLYNNNNNLQTVAWNAFVFMTFLNVCVNPFIYASQYNAIKKHIIGLARAIQAKMSRGSQQNPVTNIELRV